MQFPPTVDASTAFAGAMLSDLARVFGESDIEALQRCRLHVSDFSPQRGWVPDAIIRATLADFKPRAAPSDAVPLIASAFEVARDSGKRGWESMALPVLKNRLLAASSRTFDEADYGAPNIYYFAHLFPALIEVINSRPHASARLLQVDSVAPKSATTTASPSEYPRSPSARIRPDLWSAMLDYRSGLQYRWNPRTGRTVTDEGVTDAGIIAMPTIAASGLGEWRREFARPLEGEASAADAEKIASWVDRSSATIFLPAQYRGLWNAFLRDHVAERLEEFFVTNQLSAPADLKQNRADPAPAEDPNGANDLRRRLHQMINDMTEAELQLISIPVSVSYRIGRRRT